MLVEIVREDLVYKRYAYNIRLNLILLDLVIHVIFLNSYIIFNLRNDIMGAVEMIYCEW